MKRKGSRALRCQLWIAGVLLIGLIAGTGVTTAGAAATSQTDTELTAQAEEVITYDAAEFKAFQGRTKDEAGRKYAAARYASPRYEDSNLSGLYDENFPEEMYEWRVLSTGVKETFTAMFNYYRWLAGSADAGWNDDGRVMAQEEAYKIRGQELHKFTDGNSMFMYSQGDTPLKALKNMMNEQCTSWSSMSYFQYSAYERRKYILNPYTPELYMGFYGNWMVMNLPGTDTSREAMPFYSFPSQGYMPNDLLTADESAWTVWVDRNKIKIPTAYDKEKDAIISRDVSVKIVHRESGKTFERNMDAENAYADVSYIAFEGPREDGMSAYSGTYDVEVTGLQDAATEKAAKLCYSVTFFDPMQYLLSEVKEVSIDGVVTYVMPQELASAENGKKVASILPNEVTVTGENERSIVLPVKGSWQYDEAGSCWKNSVDASELPPDLKDPNDLLTDFPIHCEISEEPEMTFEMTWSSNYHSTAPTDGSGGYVRMKCRPESVIDSAIVYQITKPEEEYTAMERYNTETSWGAAKDEETSTFSIPVAYFVKDIGDYVALGHAEGSRKAWLSDKIIPISVGIGGLPSEPSVSTPSSPSTSEGGNANVGTGGYDNSSIGSGSTTVEKKTTDSKEGNNQEKEQEKTQEDSGTVGRSKVAKLQNVKVGAKKKGFVLTWKKNTKVSGYQVQISTKKNFKGAKKVSLKRSKNKYRISGLKPGKKYYIRIRAWQETAGTGSSKKKIYGAWKVISGKTK